MNGLKAFKVVQGGGKTSMSRKFNSITIKVSYLTKALYEVSFAYDGLGCDTITFTENEVLQILLTEQDAGLPEETEWVVCNA